MPLNESNVAQAEQTIAKLEQKLQANRSQFGDMGPPSPELARTQSNLDRLRTEVANYHSSNRPVDSNGKLTKDLPAYSGTPNRVEGPNSQFWFEPSDEQVREFLSQPGNAESLNLGAWTTNPDVLSDVKKGTSAYKTVADHLYRQAANEAQARGQGIERYSAVQLTKNPFDYIVGGAQKYAPTVVDALNKTPLGIMFGGMVNPNDLPKDAAHQQNQPIPGTVGAGDRIYEDVKTGTDIAAGMSPVSVGSGVANAVTKATNYAARSPIVKAAIAGVSGALGANAEGTVSDVYEGRKQGLSADEVLKNAYENAPLRAGVGAVVGSGADLLGQAAGASTQSLRKSPRGADLVVNEQAGGNTSTISGVKPSPAVKEAVDQSIVPGKGIHPSDYAANKVAPQLSDHLKGKARDLYKQIDENLENYHSTPEGQEPRNEKGMHLRLTAPVKKVMDMVKQNLRTGDLGKTSDTVPEVAKEMRRFLQNHTEMVRVPEDQVASITKKYGDDAIVMDDKEASRVFGTKKRLKYKNKELIEGELIDHPDSDAPISEYTPGVKAEQIDPNAPTDFSEVVDGQFDSSAPNVRGRDRRTVEEGEQVNTLPPNTHINQLESGDVADMQLRRIENRPTAFHKRTLDDASKPLTDSRLAREADNARAGSLGARLQNEMDTLGNRIGDAANTRPGIPDVHAEEYTPSKKFKTIILPAKTNSRQMVDLQRFIDTKLQSKVEDTTWLKDLDLELKKTRDQFKPNTHTGESAQLDNGQTVQGLSALQFRHHKANESMQQSLDDTGAGFRNRIHSNVTQYKSGPGRLYKDQELEQAAKSLDSSPGSKDYQDFSSPYDKKSEFELYGEGSKKPTVDFPNDKLKPIVKESNQKYSSLSDEERKAVERWVGSSDIYKRPPLSGGYDGNLLNSALKKLEVKNPTKAGSLIRNTNISPEQLKEIESGSFTNKGLSSASYKSQPKFGKDEIRFNSVDRAYSLMDPNPSEAEMVIPDGEKFRVASRYKNPKTGGTVIELESASTSIPVRDDMQKLLREAAGTNVYPQLAARAWAQAGQGPINAVTDFARFRLDPTLRAMGDIEPNPFIPDPNTPAGRIQKYLFEDPVRNALNLTKGLPAARQGDHIADEYERRQKENN